MLNKGKYRRVVMNFKGITDKNFNIDKIELNSYMQKYVDNVTMYSNQMIQYGYILFFSVYCPIAPFIAILMNTIEIRLRVYSHLYTI